MGTAVPGSFQKGYPPPGQGVPGGPSQPGQDVVAPPARGMGYPPPPRRHRTAERALATWRVVCLLHSRRKTFLITVCSYCPSDFFLSDSYSDIGNKSVQHPMRSERKLESESEQYEHLLHITYNQIGIRNKKSDDCKCEQAVTAVLI